MQLTDRITELLFELHGHESAKTLSVLQGDLDTLRQKLLVLYRYAESDETREIIIEIMHEAGYLWFRSLAEKAREQPPINLFTYNHCPLNSIEFMQLIPINRTEIKAQTASQAA